MKSLPVLSLTIDSLNTTSAFLIALSRRYELIVSSISYFLNASSMTLCLLLLLFHSLSRDDILRLGIRVRLGEPLAG